MKKVKGHPNWYGTAFQGSQVIYSATDVPACCSVYLHCYCFICLFTENSMAKIFFFFEKPLDTGGHETFRILFALEVSVPPSQKNTGR